MSMKFDEQGVDYPREIVEAIGGYMPPNSWVVTQPGRRYASQPGYSSVANDLRGNDDVIATLLDGEQYARLSIVTPNTMAVGLWLREQRRTTPIRLGLFSLHPEERYDPAYVVEVLGGDPSEHQASHNSVNLLAATGRGSGTISPILEREKLLRFSTVDFSAQLLGAIEKPDVAVAYPLGGKGNKHFVARGQYFIPAYAQFLAAEKIPTNLPAP
jgi:hypothetical protein